MLAYHNDQSVKDQILSQISDHALADEIVKGQYWEDGKGCAVGCTIHSGKHAEYETRFGIPQMLAHLEDGIFEGLPNDKAKEWPARFMGAIIPGLDLSLVGWKFLHWILTDAEVNPGIDDPIVKEAMSQCADLIFKISVGGPLDRSAADSAAWSARSAADRAADSAARSAAWSAESAAWSARSAADRAAWSARSAADSAAWSARSAADSAESSAWSAAWSAERAAYQKMAEKLIDLIGAA
jgi:hypothetical protein